MITIEQAKELCIKAHKGQWRRPRRSKNDEVSEYKTNGNTPMLLSGNVIVKQIGEPYMTKEPYHTHPIAVADMMSTEEEKIVALLHDVIEDTEAELHLNLSGEMFSYILFNNKQYYLTNVVAIALDLLTKRPEWSNYKFYIERIVTVTYFDHEDEQLAKAQKLAIKVKLGDILHNMQTATEKQKQKYMEAIPMLLKAL